MRGWSAGEHGQLPCRPARGAAYEEAARHGQEVLELLVETAREQSAALPAAGVFATSTAR